MAGIDRQRREHREDAVLELLDEVLAVVVVELVPAGEHDADLGQRRDDLVEEQLLQPVDQLADPVGDGLELLAGRPAVGRGAAQPATTWSVRPATRTWKNSSRFWLKMAQNLARSSSGTAGSSADSRTRALKSSQDSSRFRNRVGSSRLGSDVVGRR